MARADLNVMLIGATRRAEFQDVVAAVESDFAEDQVKSYVDLDSALEAVDQHQWFPDLVLLLQSWPDEFTKRQFHALIGRLPLARLICCCGAWCESDGRNRDIIPNAIRVPGRIGWQRIQNELEVLASARDPLPLTASRDEAVEFDVADESAIAVCAAVAIVSPDKEFEGYLRSVLQANGLELRNFAANESVDVVLWDIDPFNEETSDQIRQFCVQNRNVVVIAISGMAHPKDLDVLESIGGSDIVPKLAASNLIFHKIQESLTKQRSRDFV